MPIPLGKWQERLERHFSALAADRAASGFPLFALEHDLSEDELEEIAGLLRSRLAARLWLGAHWLVWVVYATEIGYDYDGDEYWRSFEERTPDWRENANHSQLHAWFTKFQRTYHGVEPSGPWADCFSIIAWPITHAILPKYLQLQLARALYNLRNRLARLDTLSPAEVGKLLAANAWDMSSRFRVFLEQEELVGRIVLALLSDKTPGGQAPIFTPTLQRIVSDLERVRSAREWLKETRRVVADRFKGAARTPGPVSGHRDAGHGSARDAGAVPAGIRPTLLLRPSGAATWSVVIEVPTFGGVARLNPDLRGFLRSTRCRVSGAGDTWLPGGWLLSGAQRRVLKAWPDTTQPLVTFERPHAALDHVLHSECRLTPGPIWLCHIGSDRIARQIMRRIVRSGCKYVVLSQGRLPSGHHLIAPCDVDCTGINAGLLSLPNTVSAEDVNWLQQLGLQFARTIRIWPAGLSGRGWDGEGQSEWLTTEAPCFGIVHDHPVVAYILRLNDGAAANIEAGRVGQPVFVRIPPLPAGRHSLSVEVRRSNASSAMPTTEGFITLDVHEPEPWVPGTTLHTGLAVSLDPHDPSLDTFWEGDVGVSILGPEGHHVTCSISLANASGAELLSQQIGMFDLPVTTTVWSKRFRQFVMDQDRAWTYLEAASGRLFIRGEELGEFVVRLERDVKPVRWVCRSVHRTTTVRLIDDTGRDQTAAARFFSFGRPAIPVPLDTMSVLEGIEAETPGGLYAAEHAQHRDAVVVSTPQVNDGFGGLIIDPNLRDLQASSVAIDAIFQVLEIWSDARLVGPLADIRRNHVLRGTINCLYSRLCGRRWAEAEAAYLANTSSDFAVQQLERSVGGSPGFAVVLRRDYEQMEAGIGPGVQWFAEVAARYDVSSEPRLCEFALRLASQPHRLSSVFGGELDGWLHRVRDKTVLLRGARLLALLAVAKAAGGAGAAIPRWKWQ